MTSRRHDGGGVRGVRGNSGGSGADTHDRRREAPSSGKKKLQFGVQRAGQDHQRGGTFHTVEGLLTFMFIIYIILVYENGIQC